MAAQKLTRGRFAQIIIMLTILIIAFTWRTIEHDSTITVTCNPNDKCTFFVNEFLFEIEITAHSIQLQTASDGWKIIETTNTLRQHPADNTWSFDTHQKPTEMSFKLSYKNESIEHRVNIKSY